jgi:opacity protein-like surface antigen
MMNRIAIVALAATLVTAPFAHAQAPRKGPQAPKKRIVPADPNAPAMFVFGRFEAARPTDSLVSSVYGTALGFGAELRARAARSVYASLGFGYLGNTGRLTVTQEATKLTTYPLEGMALFYLGRGRTSPYLGGGAAATHYAETNAIGSVGGWAVGYLAAGGVTVHMNRQVAIDARLKYSAARARPGEDEANLGGITFGVGAGFKF